MEPIFFASGAEVRGWLEAHGGAAGEVLIGFYKKGAAQRGVTYQQALDEALCFGWIDGVRKGLDAERYSIRFTPRKKGSVWSAVNMARVEELRVLGRMRPAGLAAFEGRDPRKETQYSYEAAHRNLPDEYVARFQEHAGAWAYFQAQPPSYRRVASWWVISAKREETRARRLAKLIQVSSDSQRLPEATLPRRRENGLEAHGGAL
ncbi:MAG TPA: YdeI/OmpD-associated family protein [Ktedonobacterales bacterium]|nr:YdeI/OmpD-associated family protein [Ktedonobacterales bacterium]